MCNPARTQLQLCNTVQHCANVCNCVQNCAGLWKIVQYCPILCKAREGKRSKSHLVSPPVVAAIALPTNQLQPAMGVTWAAEASLGLLSATAVGTDGRMCFPALGICQPGMTLTPKMWTQVTIYCRQIHVWNQPKIHISWKWLMLRYPCLTFIFALSMCRVQPIRYTIIMINVSFFIWLGFHFQ